MGEVGGGGLGNRLDDVVFVLGWGGAITRAARRDERSGWYVRASRERGRSLSTRRAMVVVVVVWEGCLCVDEVVSCDKVVNLFFEETRLEKHA